MKKKIFAFLLAVALLASLGTALIACDTPVSTYNVTFVTGADGLSVDTQKVKEGGKAAKPDLKKEGWFLTDWYTSADFSGKWDFAKDTVSADITLYARWVQDSIEGIVKESAIRTISRMRGIEHQLKHENGNTQLIIEAAKSNGFFSKMYISNYATRVWILNHYNYTLMGNGFGYKYKNIFSARLLDEMIRTEGLYANEFLYAAAGHSNLHFNEKYDFALKEGTDNVYTSSAKVGDYDYLFEFTVDKSSFLIKEITYYDVTGNMYGYNQIMYDADYSVTALSSSAEALPIAYVNITFDTAGGSEVPAQKVEFGSHVIRPTDPVKQGCKFDGWYTLESRSTGMEPVDFEFDIPLIILGNTGLPVTDLVICARWI